MSTKSNTENLPVTVDGATGKPDPTPRVNMSSLVDVRREMARVYRAMRCGEIDTQDGARMAYVLTSICKVLELERAQAPAMPNKKEVVNIEDARAKLTGRLSLA